MFTYDSTVFPQDGYLLLVAAGEANAEQVVQMYNEVTKLCQESGVRRIMLNAKSLTLSFGGLQVVENMYKLKQVLSDFKVARVLKHIDVTSGLIESYSEQQQINIRNFEKEAEAKAWLLAS